MRFGIRGAALLALAFVVGSCSDNAVMGPASSPSPLSSAAGDLTLAAAPEVGIRISEFHYDDAGTDAGEAIEISGPAGASLVGWSIVLYNGNGGAAYTTTALSGAIPATCGARGVVVTNYPVNGIQNGDPDGIALVGPSGVVEFISYEGTFTAVGGPADKMESVDIGVREAGTEPDGQSLWRDGSGTWHAPAANTFGTCNDAPQPPAVVHHVSVSPAEATIAKGTTQPFTATAFDASNQPIGGVAFTWASSVPSIATVDVNGVATAVEKGDANIVATAPNGISAAASLHVTDASQPPPSGAAHISEIHYDNVGTDADEKIEIQGPAGLSLTGWRLVLYNGNGGVMYGAIQLTGTIQASPGCDGTTGVAVFATPGLQNGGAATPEPDGVALVDASNTVVEFLSYEGTFTAAGAPSASNPAGGMTSADIGVLENGSPVGQSLQRDVLTGKWYGPATSSFAQCNPPTPANFVNIFGRNAGDPPLPVGFETQIFAELIGADAKEVASEFTWESLTPTIASVDADGVVHALAEGTATLKATARVDGSTATFSLPTHVATAGSSARYDNTEFGVPSGGNPNDNVILEHEQYTASFSKSRGIPNWVSFNLEASQFGSQDRCECFTFDPALPSDLARYTTADYVGSLDFYGFQYNRGHLVRSFDRTLGTLDNARTFYFTNIVPQTADNNQGPWSAFEIYLGNIARDPDKEVYVVAGVSGSKGTFLNKGKITIPASLWKVAVIVPRDRGVKDIHSVHDLEVIAVDMPNIPGIRNVAWETYKTTVDAIEAASGFDILALLPDPIEAVVESNDRAPTALTSGPYVGAEGSPVTMSGVASSDPDAGDVLTYSWSFGDGASGTGATPSHTYAQDGTYQVTLTVRDRFGLESSTATSVSVSNVVPVINAFNGATILPGETYSTTGVFEDPGADPWSATVDYGDGSGISTLSLAGKGFSLSHTYATPGTYTVTVRVSDDDAAGVRTQAVTVLTAAQGTENVIGQVSQLARSGDLESGEANSLTTKLDGAIKQFERGAKTPAVNQVGAFVNELDALVRSDRLSAAKAEPIRRDATRVIRSASP